MLFFAGGSQGDSHIATAPKEFETGGANCPVCFSKLICRPLRSIFTRRGHLSVSWMSYPRLLVAAMPNSAELQPQKVPKLHGGSTPVNIATPWACQWAGTNTHARYRRSCRVVCVSGTKLSWTSSARNGCTLPKTVSSALWGRVLFD